MSSPKHNIIRLHFAGSDQVEFMKVNADMSTDDMRVLEDCLSKANAADLSINTVMHNAMTAFQRCTGHTVELCPAPYLYDIVLE